MRLSGVSLEWGATEGAVNDELVPQRWNGNHWAPALGPGAGDRLVVSVARVQYQMKF